MKKRLFSAVTIFSVVMFLAHPQTTTATTNQQNLLYTGSNSSSSTAIPAYSTGSNSSMGNATKKGTSSTTGITSSINDLNSEKAQQQTSESFVPSAQLAMSTPNYMVSAGDIYQLSYAAGTTPVSYAITIDTTYRIRVSNLGVLNVEGLTYNQLKSQVERIVTKNYPLSGVQFVLTAPAVYNILIKGEVTVSQEKKVWALTRLSEVLSNNLTLYSSLRNVSVTDSDGKEKEYDLFKSKRFGNLKQDPYLRPGDVITVHHLKRKVTINGAVERPGTYELLDGENLKDLITVYGDGLQPLADISRLSLYRITDEKNSGKEKLITDYTLDKDLQLFNNDEVTIASFKELAPAMFFEGAINSGTVDTDLEASSRVTVKFNEGENYATLIRRNQGMFSTSSDTKNAYIIRDGKHIPINLNEILYDASFYSDQIVKANDVLLIPFKQFFVVVSGAVADPGRFPYIPDRDYNYYIDMAGGIDNFKNDFNAIKIRDKDGNKLSKSDPIQPETIIVVESNSPWYNWSKVASSITAIFTVISTTLSILAVIGVF